MNILPTYRATPEVKANYLLPSDTVWAYEKLDSTFDREWCLNTFTSLVSYIGKQDNMRTFYVDGSEIGSVNFPNSKFFLLIA